jgi:hypothetical protein
VAEICLPKLLPLEHGQLRIEMRLVPFVERILEQQKVKETVIVIKVKAVKGGLNVVSCNWCSNQ